MCACTCALQPSVTSRVWQPKSVGFLGEVNWHSSAPGIWLGTEGLNLPIYRLTDRQGRCQGWGGGPTMNDRGCGPRKEMRTDFRVRHLGIVSSKFVKEAMDSEENKKTKVRYSEVWEASQSTVNCESRLETQANSGKLVQGWGIL